MASTFSTNLAIELMGTGDQAGTWGTTTNTNLGTLIEQAISGYQVYSCSGGTDVLTIPNGAPGVARNMYFELQGTGGGTVTVPTGKAKLYFVYNNTSGIVSFIVASSTGITIPNGARLCLVSNGTNLVVATNYLSSLTLGSPLPVLSGGTGVTTSTGSGSNVLSTSPTLVTPLLGTPTSGVLTNCTGSPTFTNVKYSGLVATTAAAPTIASATTIAPTASITIISGTAAIVTITAPTPISAGGGTITFIPTGAFTTTNAGNIAIASTAVVGRAITFTYDVTTVKWYPSY